MKLVRLFLPLFILAHLSITKASAQQLVHYWNFNNNATLTTLLTPTTGLVSGGSITHVAGGISAIDVTGGTGQNFSVANVNARNGDTAGTHLRFNDPIGGELIFALPTTGYRNAVVKFASRRSGSGAGLQYWAYSTNGTTYTPFDTIMPVNGDPILETLDFSAVNSTDNNPNFRIKVSFAAGAGGTVGNNRFDNFTVDASPLPTPALVHYWNFNDNSTQTTLLTPTQSLVSGAAIAHAAGGISAIDVAGGTGQNFNLTNPNARNGDTSGTHLRFNDPIGGALVFSLPTTAYELVTVRFASRRSGSGAGLQYWAYSIDTINYLPLDTIAPVNGNPIMETLDLTGIAGADNNPLLRLRVTFAAGSGGTGGNNRFDNFTLDAYPTSSIDTLPPVLTFHPSDLSQNVAVNVRPVITFNEPVRRLNDSLLTNANVVSLIDLRLNNSGGTAIPFTASVSADSIIIIPSSGLLNNQRYYIGFRADSIEDFSNSAIASRDSVRFTTIALQTQFSAGDMVFVAYRMNATGTDDEVALLTLVDILPGTFINLTDSKYITGTPAQCAGGIVWTAPLNECIPAGSVITIQTSTMVANKGIVTGSGFGLSSGGDQVIVYTGTPATPNYITALTSNDWVLSNTSCGGSLSMIPAGLVDSVSAVNLSTAPGNVSGNSANAFYNGSQRGTAAQLRASIQNPANWTTAASGTAPQVWPAFNFPAPPTVISAFVTSSTSIRLVFNTALDSTSAVSLSNYSGISGLSSISFSSNGNARDTVVLNYSTPFVNNASYVLSVANIRDTGLVPMTCPYSLSFTYAPQVSFATSFSVIQEQAGALSLVLNLNNPGVGSVDLVVLPAPYSTAGSGDIVFASQTISLTGTGTTHTVTIPITDDLTGEQAAEYFVLALRNPVNYKIAGDTLTTIYIIDNDRTAPAPDKSIELQHVGSFDPSGSNSSTCEVVAYDPGSKRLFTTSAISGVLDIVDFTNPSALKLVRSVDMKPYGGITSVAVRGGIVAVASPNVNEQLNGTVVFLDTAGTFLKQLTVGALPDMICFTPDGTKVLVANEGQPNQDYSVDPEGSVSIIDITPGIINLSQAQVATLDFTPFNANEAALISSGIRKTKATSTLSQDIEPEFITVSANSQKAWVTLQENNAIAEVDLSGKSITDIWALGTKDFSIPGNGFDASDNNGSVLIANWPVKAFYIPDAVSHFSVGGVNYLVTANEGDEKEYAALEERTTVGASNYRLDSATYPNAAVLKQPFNLGRMRVTNLNGDTDSDGDYDQIYCVGSRSFSIWNADTKSIVFDCGDDFEMITSSDTSIAALFNADHEDNTKKGRSRSKGPEPEGVTVAEISGKKYAFVSLERVGGVMVYDVSSPSNAKFVTYKNSRSTTTYAGDHGAETLIYIPDSTTTDGKSYLVVANEISGTLGVFQVLDNNVQVNVAGQGIHKPTFVVFPNPANGDVLHFNRKADVEVLDLKGSILFKGKDVQQVNISGYAPGLYIVHTHDGASAQFVRTE